MKKILLLLAVVLLAGGYQLAAAGAQQSQEGQILEALKEARLAGDIQAAQALQAQLDELHGIPPRISPPPAHAGLVRAGSEESTGDISIDWVGDVRVTSSGYNHVKPSIAGNTEGDLWVAVETPTGLIDVYKSTNGGASWNFIISFGWVARNYYNPSIAYAKSPSQDEEWVYVACEVYIDADSSRNVEVFRFDPNCPSVKLNWTVVESGINMTQHIYPEICTDNNIFDYYYVYVTYSVEYPDIYPVWFSKSTDFGLNWGAPQNVTGSTPTNYSWPTRPDIAYGKAGMFIAFVKPGYTGSSWENQIWETHSTNYGGTWTTPLQLTDSAHNQYHPSVAAALDPNTVMIAYTRDYGSDLDVEYAYSTDEGTTWKKNLWLPYTSNDEKTVDLAVSNGPGRFHAVYWRNNNIHYTWVETDDPISWASTQIINEGSTVSSVYPKATICINPTNPVANEACVAWTDTRGTYLDVYFDTAVCADIEVKKFVWDPVNLTWVDGLMASLDDIVRFQCIINNTGGSDLTRIAAIDFLPAILDYANSATVDGAPAEPVEVAPGEFYWDFADRILEPGNIIIIEFDAKVIACGGDENTLYVEAKCADTGWGVSGGDATSVWTIQEPDLIITKIVSDRERNQIGYIVKNVGCAQVPKGHYAGLWIDGMLEDVDEVDVPLPPGAEYEGWFDSYEWPFCHTLNDVTVCADINYTVPEYDEGNNCKNGGCISAVLEWTWNSSDVEPNYVQVMMAPVAADVNGDNIADVIFSTFAKVTGWQGGGILRVISGADGSEIFSVTDPSFRVQAGAEPAVADIDLDGRPEIMVTKQTGEIICFEHDGVVKWISFNFVPGRIGLAVADLDSDGIPEIIAGNTVLNNNGIVRWTGAGGSNYVTVVADLNLDGSPEVVTGATAYHFDGTIYWSGAPYGRPAIGNFDGDPYPEIVLVAGSQVSLKEHDGTVKWGPVNIPGRGSGPPVVADFDGDGEPEIGVGGRDYYVAYETDGSIKWKAEIKDHSSYSAGSSAFDFDRDGRFEIVYSDEHFHRIFRGADGAVLFEAPGPSGTLMEQPIILDVDNDGRVEIVFAVNNYAFSGNTGIEVYGNDSCWPNARKIWNQHTYHITNINFDATVPPWEEINWFIFNNYRTQSSPPCNMCADFDDNNMVEFFDLNVLWKNWLWQEFGTDDFNIADLNCDGRVNLIDFSAFTLQWMTGCPVL